MGPGQQGPGQLGPVELYTHLRNCALPPSGPDRDQRQHLNLITLPNFWHKNQDRIKNIELYTHFRICALPPSGPDRTQRQQSKLIIPPNVWYTNQDRMENVELYTHFRKCALPPSAFYVMSGCRIFLLFTHLTKMSHCLGKGLPSQKFPKSKLL